MNRHEEIKNAYKSLGGDATFYDGMITCSTLAGKAVCKLIWNMDKRKNDYYLELALSGIPNHFSGKMLEVPVGTGILSMPVYETIPDADITCLDYSPDMMKRAKRQAEKRGLQNVHFTQGDVGKLPFEDESFDLVLSLNGFHAFPDKEAAESHVSESGSKDRGEHGSFPVQERDLYMKYIGMPMGMWVLFRKSFERNLITEFGLDRNTAKAVAVKAKRRYKEIIARLPEFEKEDRFKMNIVNCTLLAAFVLNMPDRPDVKRLTTYYAGSMMIPAMKWFCRQGGKSKFSDKDISSMKATERLKAADRNPYSWNMEFYPYPNDSGYEVRFTACGICTLMRELGMYDLVPAMCRLDYTMSEAGGASDFVREYTLASGGPYCDCGYKKKQDRNDNKGFWDRWARRYDRTISIEKNTYARILSRMKKKLDRDMYVLELACGTGVLSVQLAGNVKMLEATDFSEKMIEQAKIRPQSSRLHFSVQDATALPYAPETFDAVIISNALHIMPAPEKALTYAEAKVKGKRLSERM